jgi:hypothetical protein
LIAIRKASISKPLASSFVDLPNIGHAGRRKPALAKILRSISVCYLYAGVGNGFA